jgi:hypothetical protein
MSKQPDFRAMSEAVENWYRFYEVPPNEHSSEALCNAAISLCNEGYRTIDDIATALIGTYIGILVYEGERADVLGNPLAQVWQP